MEQEKRRLDSLDGLRGIAACIIAFVWHYQHFVQPEFAPFHSVFKVSYAYGDNLVELFFMLSGFGMMLGYGKRITEHQISFPQFMKRRIKKLYPLFILTTFVVIVLEYLIYSKTGDYFIYRNYDLYHLVLNLLLLQNGALETSWSFNSPSWVISVLMLLYAAFYLVCYIAKRPRFVYYIFGVSAILGAVLILNGENKPLLNVLFGRGLSCFSIGIVVQGIYVYRRRFNAKLVGYLSVIFVVITYLFLRFDITQYIGNFRMLMVLGLGPMIMFSALTVSWFEGLLSLKTLVLLGNMSMSVYLIHFPVQCILMCIDLYLIKLDFPARHMWLIYSGMTLVISYCYWRFIAKRYEAAIFKLFRSNSTES